MEPEPQPGPAQWVAEDLRKAERARTEELLRSSEALERRTSADAAELEAVRQELASVRAATRPLNPFDGVPDECVARICRFLPGERELGRLAQTCRNFHAPCDLAGLVWEQRRGGSSFVQQLARKLIEAREKERGCQRRRSGWGATRPM